MTDPPSTEINIDQIMRKIREEVKRRKEVRGQEAYQEAGELVPKSSTTEDDTIKKSFDHLLWKYGRRYKKIINTVPILKGIARKEHSRLADKFIHSHPITQQSLPSPLDINCLPYYINYHGFLVQVKKEEGLKGRIKSFLFKFIRFFAWWQEQINRALYQELMTQKAKMDERDRWVQELHYQQMNSLKEDLSERDKRVEDLNHRLVLIGQAKDELSRELGDQRGKIGETGSHLKGLLKQQGDQLRVELAERDKVLEDLGNRFSLFGQAKDEISRELSDQKNKIDATEKWMESLVNQQIDGIKCELAERDKVVESLNNRLVQFGRVEEELNQGIDNLKLEFTEVHKDLNAAVESVKKELSGLLEVKSAISGMTDQLRDQKLSTLDQQRRLALLLKEARKRLPEPIGPKQIKNMLKEEDHLLDAMYVAFEERFRGTREDIKERLRVYLPYVKQAKIGKGSSPIIDLGCGRGEWLEILKGEGYVAKGVEINRVMLDVCRERSLEVVEAAAIEYLRSQKANSLGAITGFHLVEHLSLKDLISLFDESLRILKPRGMIIFETPNPENLIVGAYTFHFDPTHRCLLVPESLNFIAQQRGFVNTNILRLHKYSDFNPMDEATDGFKNKWFYSETDFALIGYKA